MPGDRSLPVEQVTECSPLYETLCLGHLACVCRTGREHYLCPQVHELLPTEIAMFRQFWSGELYLDLDKAFYRELGEGKVRNPAWYYVCNWR